MIGIAKDKERLETDDEPIRKIGYLITFLAFGVFGIWSFFAPIGSSALAPGVLVVKTHSKTVQHLDGGIVHKIHVSNGNIVKKGETLISLDDTQTKAQLEIIRGEMIVLKMQRARLIAEKDLQQTVQFSEDVFKNDSRTLQAREGQVLVFAARKTVYEGKVAVLAQRVSQLESQRKGMLAQLVGKKALLASYQEEQSDLRALLEEGFIEKNKLRDIERRFASSQGDLGELIAGIASIEMKTGEAKLEVLQVKKDFTESVINQLEEVNAKIYDVEERFIALTDKQNRTIIKAPVDGKVMKLVVFTEGGVIAPGGAIMDIVPEREELMIDAEVSIMDIDRVKAGLLADVRFSVFNQAITPEVEGEVLTVSADRLVNEDNGMPYYLAQVKITQESQEKLKGFVLQPGMPAEVFINTGDRTLFEYLTQPVSNAFARALIEE